MRCLFSLVLAVALTMAPSRADDLAAKLEAIMNAPEYEQASWGVLVVDSKTGKTVYAQNADKLFTPASVTKLYSCAAALIALGPDYKFVTPVYQKGTLNKSGVLDGDLILVASGDLTFGGRVGKDGKTQFKDHDHIYANSGLAEAELTDTNPLGALEDLAAQIAKAGIKEVTGEILIDDRLFEKAKGSGSGPDAVTPIMLNDNVVDLLITPATDKDTKPVVKMKPETAYVTLDADVAPGLPMTKANISLASNATNVVSVRGKVPNAGKPVVRIFPVDDPALFARACFIECLRKAGVRVVTTLTRPVHTNLPEKESYAKMTKVAEYTSAPFHEAIKVTLKVSHNLYASALPCLVAVKNDKRTAEDGLKIQRKILADLGVETKTISFGGGAGGAQADCTTPKATVKLIQGMRAKPEWQYYKDAMPSLGVDGTLVDVVEKDSPAKGSVFGKTGTLIWGDTMNGRFLLRSKALAGTLTTKAGTELTYAIFVNNVPLPAGIMSAREGKTLGKIAETIYTHGP